MVTNNYQGFYVRESVFENVMFNKAFVNEAKNILAQIADIMAKNESLVRRASRSAEAELLHRYHVEGAMKKLAYALFDLNRHYCGGQLLRFVHMDDIEEIENLLDDFWEVCYGHYEVFVV